ncbi:PAS domain S-box protein [Paenibacillus glycanilyticus]|uniref:PAS domain S-box protein n=1 Tax=Paenibacillus glycanilyticus TaxID=126569 RepID=UPI002040C5B3|nr:EAL domain-containing protein [Paenibacillus glycanilyticus]MCM3630136.1 PAS domain S-box protein [Paenibacillus glycanilyticus]
MSLFKLDFLKRKKQENIPILSDLFNPSLFDHQSDIFLLFDRNGRLIEANQGFSNTLGYSFDEFKQLTYSSLLPDNQRQRARKHYYKLLNGEVQIFELRVLHQSGQFVDLTVTAFPRMVNDTNNGFYAVAKDLSDIKLIEQRYISLLKNMFSAAFIIDLQGNILDINEAAVKLTGYDKHEHIHFSQFIKPEELHEAMAYNQRALEGETLSFQISILHKNGQTIDVVTTLSPIFMHEQITGIIGISKDISDETRNKQLFQINKQRYESLFEQNPDAISYFDLNGNFIDCNAALEKILGYSREELLHSDYRPLITEPDLQKAQYYFEQAVQGTVQSYELACLHKKGHLVYMNITKLPIIVDNQIVGIYSIAKDITTKKHAEQALIEAESKYRSLVEKSIVGVYIIQNNIIVYANPYLIDMLGYQEALIGKSIWDVIHPADYSFVQQNIQKLKSETDAIRHPLRVLKADGEVLDVELYSNRIMYQSSNAVIGSILDVTERKRAEEMNAFLAYHDSLTELPNRRKFEEMLEQTLDKARSSRHHFAVMYMDMDRFKYINDSLGHAVGDQLLISIAKRLKEQIRENDFVARMGGDEFTVILPHIRDNNSAVEVAKRIIENIREPFYMEAYELFITTSVGISIYPDDGDDSSTLMKNADSALYRAKELGKNSYQIFTSSMNVHTYKIFTLEKDLRKAIHRNELEMYYQPKVNMNTGEIVGAEALIRWNHPEWGLVSPNEFIPLSEETGLILSLGNWVKQAVCRQMKEWQASGLKPIPVSINVTAKRFLSKDIIEAIQQVLTENELDSRYLEIEITESSLLENADTVMATLDALNKLGVKISLDDFGTGYSSLSYLKRFKQYINILKMDKSFIHDLHQGSDDNAIISAIIQLAQHMNMSVVAEGVETEEQLRILKHLKCDLVQGYLFSRPVQASAFAELLKQGYLAPLNRSDHTALVNRRQYFRVSPPYPLSALMTVIEINGKSIELGKTEIVIEDLGAGGLRFLSSIQLAVHPGILLEIETRILHQTIQLYGKVVWLKELDSGIYQYGVEFQISERERTSLTRVLHELSIQLRRDPLVPGCHFIKEDRVHYLRTFTVYRNIP